MVEARAKSGALITADLALEEGREVFAVPGEITSALSDGTNALLGVGATPLTSTASLLDRFGLAPAAAASCESVSAMAAGVLARLVDAPAAADELARLTGLPAEQLAVALSELELAGVVIEAEGRYRARP